MKSILLLIATSGILYLTLTGSSLGPGGQGLNATGGPGSNASCGGCHSGGAGITTGAVELRKLSAGINGPIVSQYIPDTIYIIKVVGNNPGLSHFGFQLSALSTFNMNRGTFNTFTSNVHMISAVQKNIAEHTAPIAKTNNQYEAVFNWKAPVAGSGSVTFYGTINAVNNDGHSTGDKPSNLFSTILTEAHPTNVGSLTGDIVITIFPNPVTDQLHISIDNAENGIYTMNVFDMLGKVIAKHTITVHQSYQASINTASWASGIYHVQLKKDGMQRIITVVK